MKKGIFIIIAIILVSAAAWFGFGGQSRTLSENISVPTVQEETKEEKEAIAVPVRLEIPKIGVDTEVEQVGQDAQGRMGVPEDYMNVGWYTQGYRPGHKGSAVLSGHFDSAQGGPAIFYRLKELEEGDDIIVTDADGKQYKYDVTMKEYYNFDALPLEEIFNTAGTASLNLITCDGVFDQSTRNYSQRLVIYSEM